MARVHDAAAMIAGMAPRLCPGVFVFATLPASHPDPARLIAGALATMREDEGLSLILPQALALAEGLAESPPMAQITLQVHSALEGVGLTAAVAAALAGLGIACNVVAGHHHDHVFVPQADASRALACLRALAKGQAT